MKRRIAAIAAATAIAIGVSAGPAAAMAFNPASGTYLIGHSYTLMQSLWSMTWSYRDGTTLAYGSIREVQSQVRVPPTAAITMKFYKPTRSTPYCTFSGHYDRMGHNCGGNFTNGWVVFTVDVDGDGSAPYTSVAYFR